MVPLKTVQGLSTSALKAIIKDRDVYIWGSGPLGRGVLISLQKSGILPVGFVDGRITEVGSMTYSLPVFNVRKIVEDSSTFVIIANLQALKIAEEMCLRYGRQKMEDYLTQYQISRPEAAIDIAGMCNVECTSCPRGNMKSLLPEGCMSFRTYTKVLNKLLIDIPHLINIELYTWGEPFLNPEIAQIIEFTKSHLPCTVSTNLLLTDSIEPVLKANPSQLNVTVNGYKEQYESNMKGASWELLVKNLFLLKELNADLDSTTNITIMAYSFNAINAKKMIKFTQELGFAIVFGTNHLNPYEHYSKYIDNEELPTIVDNEIKNSTWDVDGMLQLALKDINNPCLCQRIFPIINWDTSVTLCHTYYGPVIAKSYLTITWEDLLHKRHNMVECSTCQKKGLHRFDVDVLKRRYLFSTEKN